MTKYPHLLSDCGVTHYGVCTCTEPVKQREDGMWFITMGHAGFNCAANNRDGFKTKERAVKAHQKYAPKKTEKLDAWGMPEHPDLEYYRNQAKVLPGSAR